jgi:hypothetical protein
MYQAIVARIKTRPHPNADRIQLADVCGTTVVVGLDQQDGDLGVYFPSDGVLSHDFCVANNLYNKSARQKLGLGDGPTGFFDHHRRVRTQGFRGEKSDGFWLPLHSLSYLYPKTAGEALAEGFMFDTLNGQLVCEKWTTRKPSAGGTPKTGRNKELLAFPKHQDTDQWDYYWKDIPHGSLLTITEKIHGTSHRVGLVKTPTPWWKFWQKSNHQVVHGSRNVVLTEHTGRQSFYGSDEFRYKAVGTPTLRQGEVVYGEIVGFTGPGHSIMPSHAVDQKELPTVAQAFGATVSYAYGQPDGHAEFIVYRIVQFNEAGEGTELSHAQVTRRASQLGYRVVKTLATVIHNPFPDTDINETVNHYVGDIFNYSTMGPGYRQMAEGVVIRVDTPDGHTRFLKKKSYAFKLMEGIIKADETYEDIEENA